MSWWTAAEDSDIAVGDAVLDMVRHFLRDFSNAFQQDLSRKPTVRELEYALSLACKVNVDGDNVQGFDALEVRQVVISTASRKRARQKVRPGDIFAYRLDENTFGFGRIVADVSVGAIAEIFDQFSQQPIFDRSRKSGG